MYKRQLVTPLGLASLGSAVRARTRRLSTHSLSLGSAPAPDYRPTGIAVITARPSVSSNVRSQRRFCWPRTLEFINRLVINRHRIACLGKILILHPSTRSRKNVLGRWTSTKTSSLRVLYSGCKIVTTKYTLVWIVLVLARCMQAHQINKKR